MRLAEEDRHQAAHDEVERQVSPRIAVLVFGVVCWLAFALFAVFFFGAASVDGNEYRGGRRAVSAVMIVWGLGIIVSMAMLPSFRRSSDRVSPAFSAARLTAWAVAVGGLAVAVLAFVALLAL